MVYNSMVSYSMVYHSMVHHASWIRVALEVLLVVPSLDLPPYRAPCVYTGLYLDPTACKKLAQSLYKKAQEAVILHTFWVQVGWMRELHRLSTRLRSSGCMPRVGGTCKALEEAVISRHPPMYLCYGPCGLYLMVFGASEVFSRCTQLPQKQPSSC